MKRAAVLFALALLCVGTVSSQETTGDIVGAVTSQDGQALPGVTVKAVNPATGLERVAVSGTEGRYRFPALPPAHYTVSASLEGFQTQQASFEVVLGQTARHDVEMMIGAFSDVVEVTAKAPLLDPTSTVAGLTVTTDELASRIPLSRDVTRLSLLAPATVPGDRTFENEYLYVPYTPGQSLVSFAGASINENSYLLNGLNITNLRLLMGSSFVPMEFVEQAQVKTGGWEAEFGRATGGVVNLITKSGSNQLRGSVSAYWSPEGLQEQEPDTFQRDSDGNLSPWDLNQDKKRDSLEANASLGGPLKRDRLFFFAFGRWVDDSNTNVNDHGWGGEAWQRQNSNLYWGAMLDWQLSASHRLEGTFLSDHADVDQTLYSFDTETRSLGEFMNQGIISRGGDNAILHYSGMLSDNLLLSLQAGRNDFDMRRGSSREEECPVVADLRHGFSLPGCWVYSQMGPSADTRIAYRADIDWYVGDHALRAGADLETNRTTERLSWTGGAYYEYWLNGAVDLPPEYYIFPDLPWDQELANVEHLDSDGAYDAISNAAYVQDSWQVTPSLTLKLGLRWERFDYENANGESFISISDQHAPRLGAVWDPGGDGGSKLYGSYGVYHLPMATSASMLLGGRYYLDTGWYVLEGGVNPGDGTPGGLGEELDFRVLHEWGVDDRTTVIDSSIEPMSQHELVVGYERLLGANWLAGVRGVAREFDQVIEDIYLDKALYEVYGIEDCYAWGCRHFVLTNPGTDFSGWYDVDGDGELDPIFFTAEQLGFPDAERKYYALELTLGRRFADGWMLNASYTWSHSYGNYEGLVNSDTTQVNPYLSNTFDIAALLEHGSGDLPNDRRHNLKLYGSYSWPWGLQAGTFLWWRSGRPVNGFGMHPTDPWAQNYGRVMAFYNNGEPCPRGCAGTTDSSWALDVMLGYDFKALGANWRLHLEAFNVFNNDTVTEVYEQAETRNFQPDPNYLLARHHQPPRSVRLGFWVSF